MAISEYRKAIKGTLKVLDGANREVIKDQHDFQTHVQKLKQQLIEIEQTSNAGDNGPQSKYPGSTGNGDKKPPTRSLVLFDENKFAQADGESELNEKISKKQERNLLKMFKFYAS